MGHFDTRVFIFIWEKNGECPAGAHGAGVARSEVLC